ncbi:MAG: hypothetical protein RL754_1208 [Bacteroidota bacterium]
MKTLYLVRHSKSSWDINGIADRDRPLKGRGIRDAHLMSAFVLENLDDDASVGMYSSPATRALHTSLIFTKNFGLPAGAIHIEDALYHCTPDDLHAQVKKIDHRYSDAFMFVHNPGITEYVNRLTDARIDNVPTTGVVCMRFDCEHWDEVGKQAELIHFQYPKKLK